MDLIDELIGLSEAFEAAAVDYAICGGVALAIHGHPRFTKDIDILVRTEDLERALAAAATRGFILEGGRITFQTGTEDERAMFRVSKARGIHLLTLDLLLVGRVDDSIWTSRQAVDFEGRLVHVVSREGLIQMKSASGRPQDVIDIERLRESDPGDEHG